VTWISADEKTLLDRLDGTTSADQVARDSGLGDLRTQYALFHLLRSGLVRPHGEREPARGETAVGPPPSARPPKTERPERATQRAERAERAQRAEEPVESAPRPRRGPRRVSVVPEITDERIPDDEISEVLVPAAPHAGLGRAAAAVAALLGLAALGLATLRPAWVLLPFPTQQVERQGLERLARQARFASVDRAARAFYLLEGRYPASLEDLIQRGLLANGQRFDPSGRRLVFEPSDDAYTLIPDGDAATTVTESVAGDVLLDRTLFASVQTETGVPLVLLD
jgi:hypothetical protein